MNEKVVLVCLPNSSSDMRRVKMDDRLGVEHLGLLYLHSLIEEMNIPVTTCDFNFLKYNGRETDLDKQLNLILQENPAIVGFSPYLSSIESTLFLAKQIKTSSPDTKIILGGSHASHTATELIENNHFIDAIFAGESFYSIKPGVESLLHNPNNLENVKGVVFKKEGKIINNGFGQIADLDSLPLPYRPKEFYGLTKTASIMFSLGCIGKCTFCPTGSSSFSPRMRSIESIIHETENLSNKFWITTIETHSDDSFGSSNFAHKYYSSFANELMKRNLKVNWRSVLRATDFVDEKLLDENFWKELTLSGLEGVFIGFEAGTNERLKKLRKPSIVEINKRAYDFLTSQSINVNYGFIMFFPDSIKEELVENIRFLRSIKCDSFSNYAQKLWLTPGSKIFEDYKRESKLKKPFYLPQQYSFSDGDITKIQTAYSLFTGSQTEIDSFCLDIKYKSSNRNCSFLKDRAKDLYYTGMDAVSNPDSAIEILEEFDSRWSKRYKEILASKK